MHLFEQLQTRQEMDPCEVIGDEEAGTGIIRWYRFAEDLSWNELNAK